MAVNQTGGGKTYLAAAHNILSGSSATGKEVGKVTPEEVKEVVNITLDELIARKLINPEKYQYILQIVDKQLYTFFSNKGDSTNVRYALRQVSDDPYIDIIYFQYRDRRTLERIAEYINKDISTVKRNKKRLIIQIYNLLHGTE